MCSCHAVRSGVCTRAGAVSLSCEGVSGNDYPQVNLGSTNEAYRVSNLLQLHQLKEERFGDRPACMRQNGRSTSSSIVVLPSVSANLLFGWDSHWFVAAHLEPSSAA